MATLPTPENYFPVTQLTPLTNKPTHATLKILQTEINSCAASVQSNAGGGNHGHLTLTLTATEFFSLAGTAYTPPTRPTPNPVHHPQANSATITETNRYHNLVWAEFRLFHATDRALKKLLLEAVPPLFLEELRDDTVGFAQVSTLNLLTHLKATYAIITEDELTANLLKIQTPWDPTTSIETLFLQLKLCQKFAA